jgi:Flp pilus assembly pilin Flp
MSDWFRALWQDEQGPTMVEYALVVALIALVCLAGFVAVGLAVPKMQEVPDAMGY